MTERIRPGAPEAPGFSIVVPVRDEAANIADLLREVERALDPKRDFEVIVVDDGSRDGTLESLRSLSGEFSHLRVLRHRDGCGQSAAIATGVRGARGEWIVTMDGDGQNDPADIEKLLERVSSSGAVPAMVVGWRRDRKDPWLKRAASRAANGIYRALLGDSTPDVGCGLKVFRRDTFLSLPNFDHMHRFLPALVRRAGGTVESVEVRHRPRRGGRSKYGVVDRLLVGMVDILGVRWLLGRATIPEWEEWSPEDAPRAASADGETPEPRFEDKAHPVAVALLLGLAVFLVFGRLGALPLLDPDEGRNAEVAREMVTTGKWLVPTYNGLPYLDKPALFFKLVAISFRTFGFHEWAARLPSALFAAALLLLLYLFCRKEYGARTAALSVAIVAAMPLYAAFARIVIFDMALAFFVSLAILAGYRAEKLTGRLRAFAYVVGAASAGVATLIKGPVGFLLPALVLLVLAAVEHRKGVLRTMFHPLPLAAFLLLVAPWFIALSFARPDFPYYGLIRESLERFTRPTFHRTGPFYYYVPVIAAVCFAWSLLLPGAIRLWWRERSRLRGADRLFIVWALTVVAFFSLSQSKLPGYVLTAAVAFGVLLARLFSRALSEPEGSAGRVILGGASALAVVSLLVAAFFLHELGAPEGSTALSRAVGPLYPSVRGFFSPVFYTLLAMGAVALFGRATKRVPVILVGFFVFPISLLTFSFGAFESYAERTSSEALAREVLEGAPRATVVCFRCFPTGLAFYLERTVFLVTTDGSETTSNYIPFFLSREHRWPAQIIKPSHLEPWLRSRRRPLVILGADEGVSALETLALREGGTVRELPRGYYGLFLRRGANPDS